MHKARKDIIEAMPNIDLVIEVLDARLPFSSENPVIAQVRRHKGNIKPCLKVLSKSDLADPELTQLWCQHFEQESHIKVLPLAIREENISQRLLSRAREFFPHRAEHKAIRVMVMGIPNVGKSSLINRLAGRTIAKVGNEPAITKRQQRIDIGEGFILNDTPGILWPKVENIHGSYRLAASGAIKETAMDYVDVAFYVADYLLANYAQLLQERYQLSAQPESSQAFFDIVGAKRGCLRSGAQVDLNKICTLFINELRAGHVGRITLETPAMIEREMAELKRLQEEKDRKKLERKRNFRSSGQD